MDSPGREVQLIYSCPSCLRAFVANLLLPPKNNLPLDVKTLPYDYTPMGYWERRKKWQKIVKFAVLGMRIIPINSKMI